MPQHNLPPEIREILEGMGLDPDEALVVDIPRDKIVRDHEAICSVEEAHDRYVKICRETYTLVRKAIAEDRVEEIVVTCFDAVQHDNPLVSAMGALLCQTLLNYVVLNHKDDPAEFKNDIIAALDQAVQTVGRGLHGYHDTRTKSSS